MADMQGSWNENYLLGRFKVSWLPTEFSNPAILPVRYINKIHAKYANAILVGTGATPASFNNQILEMKCMFLGGGMDDSGIESGIIRNEVLICVTA